MKLSVSITTYNHEHYIAQAIESALMQETDFAFEILIGEDDSSDGTRRIAERYGAQYPDRIRLFLNDRENVIYVDGKPTGKWNLVNNLNNARGQYVALLDGDDYWISPHKLQQQVDFLEDQPRCAICGHAVVKAYEDGRQENQLTSQSFPRAIHTLDDLLERNFLTKSSVVYRNGLFGEFPAWYYSVAMADWPLHILNAQYGDIGYINQPMAIHRIHGDGVWTSESYTNQQRVKIAALRIMGQHLSSDHKRALTDSIARLHILIVRALARERDYGSLFSYVSEALSTESVPIGSWSRASAKMIGRQLKRRD